MRRIFLYLICASMLFVWASACEGPLWDAAPTTTYYVNPIVEDESLSAQEKRDRLEKLGLSPLVINALLKDERLGNQFGGDLRTAYEKVVGDRLDELTPDEAQAYSDAVAEVGSMTVSWDDDIAQMIVDLFVDNRLQTREELGEWLEDPANLATLPAKISSDELDDVFVTFDPERLLEKLP